MKSILLFGFIVKREEFKRLIESQIGIDGYWPAAENSSPFSNEAVQYMNKQCAAFDCSFYRIGVYEYADFALAAKSSYIDFRNGHSRTIEFERYERIRQNERWEYNLSRCSAALNLKLNGPADNSRFIQWRLTYFVGINDVMFEVKE